MTPTNASLGGLDPAKLPRFDASGKPIGGGPATKEAFLRFCMYGQRRDASAVVRLHSTHSVALSILADVDPDDVLPPLTAYFVMRADLGVRNGSVAETYGFVTDETIFI